MKESEFFLWSQITLAAHYKLSFTLYILNFAKVSTYMYSEFVALMRQNAISLPSAKKEGLRGPFLQLVLLLLL